jgi:hypothetical protein
MAKGTEIGSSEVARYGWVPAIPDYRDIIFRKEYKIPATLPSSVDLRPQCSKIEGQWRLGSCTANALVGAMEFLMIKDKKPCADLSRLFV